MSTNDQINLVDQIMIELENEEIDTKKGKQSESVVNAQENIEHLGIPMNQEGISTPKYGSQKSKKGRKSLKKKRKENGQGKEQ